MLWISSGNGTDIVHSVIVRSRDLYKLKERAKDETHALTINPSWISKKATPYKANKLLCHELSTLTFTISSYTIRDLERLQG